MKRKTQIATIIIVGLIVGFGVWRLKATASNDLAALKPTTIKQPVAKNYCAGQDEQVILVSIEKRHLWACEDGKTAYDSPVVTGYMNKRDNATPTGTYKIYAKQKDRYLTGSDEKGSWNVHVDYWMPFLYNKYGAYGFHDALWRKDSDFGKVDPYSISASHGCVELPLTTSKWLYEWSSIGTTVTIQS